MDEPINPGQKQLETDQISVQAGGKETAPTSVEAPRVSEGTVESAGEHVKVEIPDDVREAGVKDVNDDLEIPKGVQAVPSIPKGPVYDDLPTDQAVATQQFQTGEASKARTWRALIAIKEIAKGLFGPRKPQEVN